MFERTKQGAVDVIAGDDPLNADHVDQLANMLDQCLSQGQPRVVLDMKDVALIDSAGLEMLLSILEKYQQRGGCLKLATPNPLCKEILSVTGIGKNFETFADTPTAVRSFVQ